MRHALPSAPPPVFLDGSGRRRRIMKIAGAFAGVLLVVSLGLVVAALSGTSPVQLPGFPTVQREGVQATTPPVQPAPTNDGTTNPVTNPSPGVASRTTPATAKTQGVGHGRTNQPSHPAPTKK